MLPMAFSMGAQAYNVNIADTVCTRHREYFKEKWETVQPSYLIDVVSVSTWKDNWFLNVSGGTSAFLGSPLGCEDLFGRMKPTLAVSAGKWFTPAIGGRLSYQGFRFKDSRLETQSYQFCHADLLWNVLAGVDRGNTPCRWSLIPYAGAGIIHQRGRPPSVCSFLRHTGQIPSYRPFPLACGTGWHHDFQGLRRLWCFRPIRG